MTPFADLPWFLLLLVISLPAVALGLLGRSTRWYRVFATAVMTVAIFSNSTLLHWTLAGVLLFVGWESALVLGYAALKRHWDAAPVFYAVVIAALLPLLRVKFALSAPSIFAFLGVSYITFRCVEVIIETHDGLLPKVGVTDFLTFLMFFPTLLSGPIDRFRRFRADHVNVPSSSEYRAMLDAAVPRLYQGVLYKFVLAAGIQLWWLGPVTAQPKTVLNTVSYMYAYGLYLFFDFAGYSAFAVGTSYVFGIRVMDNFNRPFLAQNIREFWNRWHISLSSWFRDFVFMRFVMLNAKRKWLKSRQASSSAGYLLTMGLMGAWHGLTANYLLYGLYHGILLAGYEWFAMFNKGGRLLPDTRLLRAVSVFVTIQAVFFGFLIFSGRIV